MSHHGRHGPRRCAVNVIKGIAPPSERRKYLRPRVWQCLLRTLDNAFLPRRYQNNTSPALSGTPLRTTPKSALPSQYQPFFLNLLCVENFTRTFTSYVVREYFTLFLASARPPIIPCTGMANPCTRQPPVLYFLYYTHPRHSHSNSG